MGDHDRLRRAAHSLCDGDAKKDEAKSGDAKKDEAKSGDAKKGEAKSDDAKKGEAKSGDTKGDTKKDNAKSGNGGRLRREAHCARDATSCECLKEAFCHAQKAAEKEAGGKEDGKGDDKAKGLAMAAKGLAMAAKEPTPPPNQRVVLEMMPLLLLHQTTHLPLLSLRVLSQSLACCLRSLPKRKLIFTYNKLQLC